MTSKVEEQRRQLEEQKRAAEAAFNIASGGMKDRDTIPGLDGSFPDIDIDSGSLKFPVNITIPENLNLKEILESVQRKEEEAKGSSEKERKIIKQFIC